MDHNYRQLSTQILIDLLADETEQYTKAFISGKPTAVRRTIIHALIAEINRRKKEETPPTETERWVQPNNDAAG